MKIIGNVKGIFSATVGTKGLPRPVAKKLEAVADYGIKGDKFAGKNLDKAVMIVGTRTYDIAKENDIDLLPGSFGENILLDFDPHDYPNGTIFTINTAKLKISEPCSLCNHLGVFDTRLPKLILHHRGLYCKVIKSGTIRNGDMVQIEK